MSATAGTTSRLNSISTHGSGINVDEKQAKRVLGIVFFTVLMDLIGFGIVIPIQPFFAETLGARPATITLLGASFSLMQFIFAPFWGRVSDRVGRRPIMLLSIAMTSVGYFLFGLANTLVFLFLARMLAGLGSANISTAYAMIADSTTPDKRAKGMGLIGAAFGLGFILGPAIGGVFVQFGVQVPIYIAAGLSALNLCLAAFWLPETLSKDTNSAKTAPHRLGLSWSALKQAATLQNVVPIFGIYLVYTTAFAMMEQVLGLFIEHTWLGVTLHSSAHAAKAARLTMYALVAVGITATIVQGGLIGKFVKRFGEKRVLMSGVAVVAVSLALVPLSAALHSYPLCLLFCMGIAFGSGLINPSLSSLLSRSVGKDVQGGTLGLGQSLASLGRVLGPAAAGLLFQLSPSAPFLIGGTLVFLCLGFVATIKAAGPT